MEGVAVTVLAGLGVWTALAMAWWLTALRLAATQRTSCSRRPVPADPRMLSIFKPVPELERAPSALDDELTCLAEAIGSFVRQLDEHSELLLGIPDRDRGVWEPFIRRWSRETEDHRLRVVFREAPNQHANPKIAWQEVLAASAQGDLWLWSDADVVAPPGFPDTGPRRMVAAVQRVVGDAGPAELNVAYGGGYASTAYSAERIRGDLIRSTIGAVVLLALVFVFVYRGLWALPLALVPLGVGLLAGFGLYACFSTVLSPLTGAAGGILAGLGVDYCIHGLSAAGRPGESRPRPHRIGVELSGAMATACVSSMIGFGAIATSSIPALQRFGLLGMLGLAGTLAGALAVLPALLAILQRKTRRFPAVHARLNMEGLVRRIAARPRACAAGTSLLMAAAALWLALGGVHKLRWENDPRDLEPKPNPAARTQETIERLFSGTDAPLPLLVEADSPRGLLRAAHRAREHLLAAGAGGVFGIGALLPAPARTADRERRFQQIDAQRVLGDFRSAIEHSRFKADAYRDYMTFLRRLLRPAEPPRLDALRGYPALTEAVLERGAFAQPRSPRRAVSMVFGGRHAAGSDGAFERALQESVADLPGATLTGMPIVGKRMQQVVRQQLPWLMGVAGVFVCLWLLAVFRSPAHVTLILLPAAGAFLTVGILAGAGAVRLNPITLVIVPLVAGLGVDDGVFFVRCATGARGDRLVARLSVTTLAITMTTVTTALAFTSLILTSTPAIRAMGVTMAAGIVGAWGTALFLLVPLLIIARPGRWGPGDDPDGDQVSSGSA